MKTLTPEQLSKFTSQEAMDARFQQRDEMVSATVEVMKLKNSSEETNASLQKINTYDYVLIPKAMLILLQNCLQRDIDSRGSRREILQELNKSTIAPEDLLDAEGKHLLPKYEICPW